MKLLPLLFILGACTPPTVPHAPQTADEYVLVEFASKLEEDYEKNGGAALKETLPKTRPFETAK